MSHILPLPALEKKKKHYTTCYTQLYLHPWNGREWHFDLDLKVKLHEYLIGSEHWFGREQCVKLKKMNANNTLYNAVVFNHCGMAQWCAANSLQVYHKSLGEGNILVEALGCVSTQLCIVYALTVPLPSLRQRSSPALEMPRYSERLHAKHGFYYSFMILP